MVHTWVSNFVESPCGGVKLVIQRNVRQRRGNSCVQVSVVRNRYGRTMWCEVLIWILCRFRLVNVMWEVGSLLPISADCWSLSTQNPSRLELALRTLGLSKGGQHVQVVNDVWQSTGFLHPLFETTVSVEDIADMRLTLWPRSNLPVEAYRHGGDSDVYIYIDIIYPVGWVVTVAFIQSADGHN